MRSFRHEGGTLFASSLELEPPPPSHSRSAAFCLGVREWVLGYGVCRAVAIFGSRWRYCHRSGDEHFSVQFSRKAGLAGFLSTPASTYVGKIYFFTLVFGLRAQRRGLVEQARSGVRVGIKMGVELGLGPCYRGGTSRGPVGLDGRSGVSGADSYRRRRPNAGLSCVTFDCCVPSMVYEAQRGARLGRPSLFVVVFPIWYLFFARSRSSLFSPLPRRPRVPFGRVHVL